MKKLLSVMLCLLLICTALPTFAFAASATVGEALTEPWSPEKFVEADWLDSEGMFTDDGEFTIVSGAGNETIWTVKNYDLSDGFIFKGQLKMKNAYNNYYGEWCSAYFGTDEVSLEIRIKNDTIEDNVPLNTYTAYIFYNGVRLARHSLSTEPNGKYVVAYADGKVSVNLNGIPLQWTLIDGGDTTNEVPVDADLANAKLGLRLSGNYGPRNSRHWSEIYLASICQSEHNYATVLDADCDDCGYERSVTHTGWYYDNAWYYYANGSKATDWLLLGDTWYYLNKDGVMQTGWQQIGYSWYYFNEYGAMHTGWLLLGDTWYYLADSGNMLTGWQYIGGYWYYLNEYGAMVTGWQYIGGAWYYFNAGGNMHTGWLLLGTTWYYLADSGAMQTGWQYIGGYWYYLNEYGAWVA